MLSAYGLWSRDYVPEFSFFLTFVLTFDLCRSGRLGGRAGGHEGQHCLTPGGGEAVRPRPRPDRQCQLRRGRGHQGAVRGGEDEALRAAG